MNKFISGPLGTFLLFAFILIGSGLIIARWSNDGLVFYPVYGTGFLVLAAVIRVWKGFIGNRHSSS